MKKNKKLDLVLEEVARKVRPIANSPTKSQSTFLETLRGNLCCCC